jgi:hypothetical protein
MYEGYTYEGQLIQGFVPDPSKHLGTVSAAAVLKVGAGGTHNITGWIAVTFWPTTADGYVTLNAVTGSVIPIYYGMANTIVVHPQNVTQLVPSVECIICGM